jgi:hypothetical protein
MDSTRRGWKNSISRRAPAANTNQNCRPEMKEALGRIDLEREEIGVWVGFWKVDAPLNKLADPSWRAQLGRVPTRQGGPAGLRSCRGSTCQWVGLESRCVRRDFEVERERGLF